MSTGQIVAVVIGCFVVVALSVMSVMIVLKKRKDRLNDVHNAMQLTSNSQLKASTEAEDETPDGYSSFGPDIVID